MVNCMQVSYTSMKPLTKERGQRLGGNRAESTSCSSYSMLHHTTDFHFRKCFRQFVMRVPYWRELVGLSITSIWDLKFFSRKPTMC